MIMRATARPKFEHGNLFPLFPDFSFDVLLLILEQCSPMDIAQLFYTSNRLRCLIESHPHLWLVAFANLSRGDAPSPPLCPQGLEAARNYSVVAYVTWIFGGGKCTYCRRETMALPFQFALKFRACKKACDAALRTPKGLFVDKTHKFDDFNWGKYLPRVLSKPQRNGKRYFVYAVAAPKQANREMEQALDVTKGRPLRGRGEFLLRTISELQEELEKRGRDQTAIQQNALDLAAWKDQYISEREKSTVS
ncbi:hypothetical protein C8F01DRAFT_363766 [Mycena amicta]|nr:hypothetical protein C8F01DRAFT_363766 [Mycena amicta]